MERTGASPAAPGPGADPVSELATTTRRRHPARAVAASLTAVALLAAGVGIVAANGSDDSRRPLVLTPGATPAKEAPARLGGGSGWSPYRFRLAIAAPDLGTDAPVARLEAPAVDDARVGALAGVLGLDGAVTRTPSGGWQVLDGGAVLTVEPTSGGWAVSYGRDTGASSPGSVPGSDGSGVSSDPGTGSDAANPSTGGEPAIGGPQPKTDPAAPTTPSPPPTQPKPPANLPDAAGAERIARALLERLGVADDSWSANVEETNADDVACAPEPCAVTKTVATTRFVVLRPKFESVAIDGLSWQVQIGDNGDVLAVYGTWTKLRTLDRYPLRSVDAVFADLVAGKGTSATPVPMGAIEVDGAAPDYVIAPISVTIDRITLGFAVMPASDDGVAVVDLVPTYVFSGTADGGGEVVQELVAVEATVAPPVTSPDTPSPDKPLPDAPGASPPVGKPEPQPFPATEPTVSGTPPT